MSEYFEYIDAYFQKELSDAERVEFEKRCIDDEAFANDVAFYISSRSALRDMLLEEKKESWSAYNGGESQYSVEAPVRKLSLKKWLPYAAAACLVLVLGAYALFSSDSPEKMAGNYVSHDLSAISQTMDASRDTLQSGIAAFNKKDYESALKTFKNFYQSHPDNTYALKYIGQTYLVTGQYDRAIQTFQELGGKPAYSNPGLFLQGVSLLKRNQPGDRQLARTLFEQVVAEKLDGEVQASQWLASWPGK